MYKIKNIEPRKYQKEITKTAKANNTLAVLPTGVGKTFIAILTALERLEQHPISNILVLTPTKPLSAQIQKEFQKNTDIPKDRIILLTGAITPKKRQELWEQAIVIIATPQTIQKDIEAGRISLSPTSLLTIDECITEDTKIRLTLDKEITVKDLFEKKKKKLKIYVESLNQKTGSLESTELLKVNKIKNNKKIIKIISRKSNEINVTEDHLILISRNNEPKWIKANQLKLKDKIASSELKNKQLSNKIIISEKNIIKTFSKKQQRLTSYYKKAIKLREIKNIGAIKIARILKTKEYIIRNYINKPYRKPVPVNLIKKLEEENLIPLKYSNPKLKIITRIIGHLYGDGWLYEQNNKSPLLGFSGKKEDLWKIQQDLDLLNIKYSNIFSRITESKITRTEKSVKKVRGTINSFHVTDSKLTRIMKTLKVPSGNKTNKKIEIPKWLMNSSKTIKKEFLSALMGSEAHKPINKKGTRQFHVVRLSFNQVDELKKEGEIYSNQIIKLFEDFGISCNSKILNGNIRKDKTKTLKFLITISNSNKNMIKFLKNINYTYSGKKRKEAYKVLKYLIQKEEELVARKKLYKKANELRKNGLKYKDISKKLNIGKYIIRHWLFKENPNHSSVELEPYDIWKKKNKDCFDVDWDEIKEIKKLKKKNYVYDLTVKKNHNYIANNIIVHNCHRSRENFANTKVASHYQNQSKFPRILALTASPGGDKERINEVKNNLFIESIEIRTEEDIKEFIQKKEITWLEVNLPEKLKEINNLIRNTYKYKLKDLKKIGFTKPTNLVNKKDLLMLQLKLRKELNKKTPTTFYGLYLTALLIKIDYASELLETQGLSSLNDYFAKLENETSKAAKTIIGTSELRKAISLTKNLLEEDVKHPKLYMLKGLVKKELISNSSAKIIVFANYRSTIDEIINFLNQEKEILPAKLIGQKSGLTQQEQIETIKKFEDGTFNVLVCSSIGEEGIDIKGATTAIMYDQGKSSEIRKIQRAGRVARLETGKIISLLTKDTREMGYYYASKRKENKMKNILKDMQKETQSKLIIN